MPIVICPFTSLPIYNDFQISYMFIHTIIVLYTIITVFKREFNLLVFHKNSSVANQEVALLKTKTYKDYLWQKQMTSVT